LGFEGKKNQVVQIYTNIVEIIQLCQAFQIRSKLYGNISNYFTNKNYILLFYEIALEYSLNIQ